jgi:hypothetical protein
MEDLYSIHPGISRAGGGGAAAAASEASGVAGGAGSPPPPPPQPPPPPADLTELVKAQIAGHPRYPSLLSAYIECRKVPHRRMDRICSYLALTDNCGKIASSITRFLIWRVSGGRAAGGGYAAGGDRAGAARRRGRRRGGRRGPRARRVHGTPSAHPLRAPAVVLHLSPLACSK